MGAKVPLDLESGTKASHVKSRVGRYQHVLAPSRLFLSENGLKHPHSGLRSIGIIKAEHANDTNGGTIVSTLIIRRTNAGKTV
eukprot:scaffold6807_cov220-Amphora_coffeaeformis.AAC.9